MHYIGKATAVTLVFLQISEKAYSAIIFKI
jgi:hypothetical protein